jgi:hypothetical protein
MVGNFSKRLEPLGIIVRELTGGWDVTVTAEGMKVDQPSGGAQTLSGSRSSCTSWTSYEFSTGTSSVS